MTARAGEGVYGLLKKDGYNVGVVQNPTVSLEDDAAVTKRTIDAQGGPVVLVGHSYGGAVITEAGNNPNVAALVYIAAFAPDTGESVNTLIEGFPRTDLSRRSCPRRMGSCSSTGRSSTTRSRRMSTPTWRRSWPTRRFRGVWTPSGGTISEAAWHNKPSWYVIATDDRMIPPPAQREMSGRTGATVEEVAADDSLYVSQPAAVAEVIAKAASEVRSAAPMPVN